MRARRQHPWFTLHLPRYLAVMQADTLASSAMIDDEIVAEVVKLGFRRSDVIDSIHKRVQNKARYVFCPASLDAAPPCSLGSSSGPCTGSSGRLARTRCLLLCCGQSSGLCAAFVHRAA